MRFSLHTAEICLHNICQQPEQLSRCWNNMKSAALPSSCCWHPRLSFALSHQGGGQGEGEEAAEGLAWCMRSWGFNGCINCLEQVVPYLSLSLLHCLPLPTLEHDRTTDFSEHKQTRKLVFFGLFPLFLFFPQKIFTSSKLRLRSYHGNHSRLQLKQK